MAQVLAGFILVSFVINILIGHRIINSINDAPDGAPAGISRAASDRQRPPSRLVKNATQLRCKCVDCPDDELCGGLWRGVKYPGMPTGEGLQQKRLHVVVSHCDGPLDWMADYLAGFNVVSIHVVSKCGHEIVGAPAIATVERLPNVGRCDHAYAHYIASVLPGKLGEGGRGLEGDDSVVVFLKDDIGRGTLHQRGHDLADIGSMIGTASSSNGFACRTVPTLFSAYHDRDSLFGYKKVSYNRAKAKVRDVPSDGVPFGSRYANVGDFFAHLGAPPPGSVIQVCYGGVFAASARSILRVNSTVFSRMRDALGRGDNIAEGHYAERTWAPLIAAPLEPYQAGALAGHSSGFGNPAPGVHGVYLPKGWKGRRDFRI